jgi:hypothetical protein
MEDLGVEKGDLHPEAIEFGFIVEREKPIDLGHARCVVFNAREGLSVPTSLGGRV